MDEHLSSWCELHLGSPAEELLLHAHHLTEAVGVRLADGREVMVKIRDTSPRIDGCATTQRWLWERGLPCPQLLAGPAPIPPAEPPRVATAEEWLPGGEVWLGPSAPERYAVLLARMVSAAPPLELVAPLDPPVPWLHYDHSAPGRIWPPPASLRWDPHRIEADLPDLVVQIAERTRRRLLADDCKSLAPVVAHGDYEAQNTRWFPDDTDPDGVRPVVLDWDSVVALPEAVLVGCAAAGFVSPDPPDLASLEQTERFLAAYASERGRRLTATELQISYATGLWVAAYNAAFEYLKGGPGAVAAALPEQSDERLRRAAA